MSRIDYKNFLDDSMLSPQEKEVLRYRKKGVPGRKIAEKLGVKIETVWTISHNIVLKCTGQYDNKKHYEYVKKSFNKRMSKSEEDQKKFKEQQKKYRSENKDKIKEYSKSYYERNKDELLAKQKKYYEANKEKIAKLQKEYYQNNKDKISEYQRKRYKSAKRMIEKSERIKRNEEICRMFSAGETVVNISKKYGLSRQTIYNILSDSKQE